MRKLLFALAFIFGMSTVQATVYYVDSAKANNTGAGTSWATAKKDIQNAIALALVAGDEVWVKKGTYKPTVMVPGGTTNRDMSFQVTDGIKLYGGFAGTETLLTQRNLNLTANRTILSGDIGNVNDTSDNALHVIVTSAAITNTTTIDGFTITKGVASPSGFVGIYYRAFGGGLHNLGSPVLSNLIFTENFADFYGGGMYNTGTPTMTNITFNSNYSVSQGGALVNLPPGNLNMSNCTFTGNGSATFGGAILNANTMTLNGVSFSGNSAQTGGAIHSQGNATITNARFKGNSTSGEGGAISNYTSPIYISNAVFSDNFTSNFSNGGGALSTRVDTLSVLSNVIFTRNSSTNGGAIRIYSNGKATFNNCTVFENTSSNALRGGAMYIDPSSGAAINNCIFWNNRSTSNINAAHREEIYSDDTVATKIQVKNSIVRDATGSPLGVTNATFTNCSNKDPMFVNSANPIGTDSTGMTSDDGLALLSCSPAINTGVATTPAIPADILGNNRVGSYDRGAYEFQGAATLPILAPATISITANQLGTTTYGNCAGIVATIAAGGQTSTIAGSTTTKVYVQGTAQFNNGQPYVRRYYDITPATNASTATANITLYFSQADFTNYNSNNGTTIDLPTGPADATGIGNLRISQQHGTSATGTPGTYSGWAGTGPAIVLIDPADTNIIWNSTASRWEVTFAVTGFSGFFAHASSSVPLPLNLVSFTAQPDGNANRLDWTVSMDDLASTFTIERSGNGYDFKEIGTSAVTNRSNNVFYDDEPLSPISYYRLRIGEAEGMSYYSRIVSVRRDAAIEGNILITPVPAHDAVSINCTGLSLAGTDTKVYNTTGQMIMRFRQSASSKIDVSNWAPGVYMLHFANGTVKRLIKK